MKIAFVIIAILLGIAWITWGIYDLTYNGDPRQISHITDKVSEYAMTLNSGQVSEINTWYFGKAQSYISEFSMLDMKSGEPVDYVCSWPAKQATVELGKICTVRIVDVNK